MPDRLHTLTATDVARRIAGGEITAEAVVRSCLEQIEAREPDVAAWAYLDRDKAIAAARERDRSGAQGDLYGIPVAFKDIVDTADLPTAYGSPIYHAHRPTVDAACVALTRRAGGIVLGKTVTTEFAFRYPGKTANPHDRRHSPGGSSSGSAAAVADHMVPLAVGTQTAGSVIRPAAYCGVYGFKPTFGLFSYSGVRHMSESCDTLGYMARSLEDIALFRSVLLGTGHNPLSRDPATPRIGFCRTPYWDDADAATRKLLEDAAEKLSRAGAHVSDFEIADDGQALLDATWLIYKFEGARIFAHDRATHPDNVSSAVRAIVDEGFAIPVSDYVEALQRLGRMRERLNAALEGVDAILTPSAAGEAPKGLTDTGPVMFNFLWTVAYTPALTLPVARGPNGLPLGIQLVARQYADDRLLDVANWVAPKVG